MKKIVILIQVIIYALFISGNLYAKLSDEKIEEKKTGWYITGLPLINYTSDNGLGYGARLYLYDNGDRTDVYFDEVPYFTQLYAQFYTTTNGFSYHELNLDKYNIFDTRYRIVSAAVYDSNINENFFGIGGDTTRNNLQDNSGNEYSTYEDYEVFLKSNDYQYFKYNNYQYEKLRFIFNLSGDIIADIKFLAGFEIKYANIDTWKGKEFEGDDGNDYISGDTLLDLSKDHIIGFEGGWVNSVKIGTAYDTRDYEPDPGRGFYIDYSFLVASRVMGSDYNYYRSTAGARMYLTIFGPLVLAARAAYTDASADTPFFEMHNFEFLPRAQEGLGGNRTLRGYPSNRFVAKTMTLGNMELRFKFAELTPGTQRFAFKLVAFTDTGNAYDKAYDPFSSPRFKDYKFSYGGGLVIAWNLATIIHAYYSVSRETTSVSIDFNHSI